MSLTAQLIHPTVTMRAVEKLPIISLAAQIATEADAYKYLEEVRWGDEAACPHCGVKSGHYFLTPKNGMSRRIPASTRALTRP